MVERVLCRGAEAVIKLVNGRVIKERVSKSYRLRVIDERLRKERTRQEAKLLSFARRAGVNAPQVFDTDEKEMLVIMEFVDAPSIKDVLDSLSVKEQDSTMRVVGECLAKLHNAGIVHGDLTTSNLLLKDGAVFFIDFGLGSFSDKKEDFAVDLHLLREALESKHSVNWERYFKCAINGYESVSDAPKEVLNRLVTVEGRGRYKH